MLMTAENLLKTAAALRLLLRCLIKQRAR